MHPTQGKQQLSDETAVHTVQFEVQQIAKQMVTETIIL